MCGLKEIKCVVWDLDNTVWDGIILEGDEVKLKPGIKTVIETLDNRGILNSISSKGNYEDAMQKLKEFNLHKYFLYPQISWNAKSISIAKIQQILNISMDTFMFVDDQRFERDEVRSEHPEILCIAAEEYKNMLSCPYLKPKFITQDSKRRRLMYMEDNQRKKDEDLFNGPRKDFLQSLNIHFTISEAKDDDLERAEELTIRTNQLNATGKTYSYDELKKIMGSESHRLLACEMRDKYGTYGKIGIALTEDSEDYVHIKLLLMSCRVMSFGVGTVLLSYIMQEARKNGQKVRADFKHTGRNKIMYTTFKFGNFKEVLKNESDIILENDVSFIQDFPPYVKVTTP